MQLLPCSWEMLNLNHADCLTHAMSVNRGARSWYGPGQARTNNWAALTNRPKVIAVASEMLFPTCQVRVARFYVRRAAPSSSSFFLLPPPSSSFFLAGSHLPALDRREPRRISSASSWYQWSSPDFNRRESERCGPRRTATGESLSAVGLAGLQPARVWALWASPDFNQRGSERCGPRRTSTSQIRRAWASADFNRTSTARNKAISNAKENAR